MLDQIIDHVEIAKSKPVPYLLPIDEFRACVELAGERYQNIEDILWDLFDMLDVDQAYGIWLDHIGAKVGEPRPFMIDDPDIFKFNSGPGFNEGKLDFIFAPIPDILVIRNDPLYRRAIKAQVAINMTSATREETINAIKLITNSSKVWIKNKEACHLEIIIIGVDVDWIHVYSKNKVLCCLSACTNLDNIYYHNTDQVFRFNDGPGFNDGGFPLKIDDDITFY